MLVKAFLSHTSSDKDLVGLVQENLTRENAWYDATDIENGDCIPDKINEGLRNATHFVLFWSEKSCNSPWVRTELNRAFMRHLEGKCKLLIFVLDNTDLPEVLKSYKYDKIDRQDLASSATIITKKILSEECAVALLSSFVNRTKEVGEIEDAVRTGCKLIVLSGIFGIGKYSIAEKAFSWIYPNRASNSIVLDFSRIQGVAELSLELSRKTKSEIINDNQGLDNQFNNIRYCFEIISANNYLLILKDVKTWLAEDGTALQGLQFLIDLIVNTELFNNTVIMTSTRYINIPVKYSSTVRQIRIQGLSDAHIANIIQNNLPQSFPVNSEKNEIFAKRLYGYPLGAKLAAYRIAEFGYDYFLMQTQKIYSLQIELAKQLVAYAKLNDDCSKYLKVVALCKSKLRNEEYAAALPELATSVASLADEAFFAGITRFNDDGCYQIEPIVEDYYYDLAFTSSDRKQIIDSLSSYLLKTIDFAKNEDYLRLVPVAVHILTLGGRISEAKKLRIDLIDTIVSSMWDQYNHMEYDDALQTADSLLETDSSNKEALYVKARCLTRFESYSIAEEILLTLLEEDTPNSARYHYAIGLIRKRQSHYQEAIELFQISSLEKTRYLSPYREMADCYILTGELEEAEKYIRKAKKIDEGNVYVAFLEALLAQKKGAPEKAIEILEKETLFSKDPARTLFRRGRAYDQLGNEGMACSCYSDALKYNSKLYDAALSLLSHKIISDPSDAESVIETLKKKLRGKQRAVLTNIEARFIGYTRKDEEGALSLLDSVGKDYRDRQWYAVKIQLFENLIEKHKAKGRMMVAGKCMETLKAVSAEFSCRYREGKPSTYDLLPEE